MIDATALTGLDASSVDAVADRDFVLESAFLLTLIAAHQAVSRADLARQIADAGVNIDTVYVATNNRVVFHSADMDGLRSALGPHATHLH